MSQKPLLLAMCALLNTLAYATPSEDVYNSILSKIPEPAQKCELQLMKELGWTFHSAKDNPENITAIEGAACLRESLWDAQENGDMRILVNSKKPLSGLSTFERKLPELINSNATMCGFKYRMGDAISSSIYKISGSNFYKFGSGPGRDFVKVDVLKDSFGRTSSNTAEWRPIDARLVAPRTEAPVPSSFAGVTRGCRTTTCLQSNISPSRAVRSFYNTECYSECAVGLQVAQLTTLLELFGDKDLDAAFTKEEIAIGNWGELERFTKNPLWDPTLKGVFEDKQGVESGKIGKQAMIGLAGYIGNVRGERALDNPTDRGENFIIVNLTQRAADLLGKGELENLNKTNLLIWDAYNSKNLKEAERLLLSNPLYDEITVFVHPLGVWSFGKHIVNLLKKNPRTEYAISFYPNSVNRTLFGKFAGYYVKKCMTAYEQKKPLPNLMAPLTPTIAQSARNLIKITNNTTRTNYVVERKNAAQIQSIMNDARVLGNYVYLLTEEGRMYVGSGARGEFKETTDTIKGMRLTYIADVFNVPPDNGGSMALYGITTKNEIVYLDPRESVFKVSVRSNRPKGVNFVKIGNDARKQFVAKDDQGNFYVWEEDRTGAQWTKIEGAPANFIRTEHVIK